MSEVKKVPEIRFAGFAEPWEQRKLTEFVQFYSGLTYAPSDVRESGTLVLRSSNVNNGEIVNADNVYVRPEIVNSENVKKGDIIVVVRNGSRSLIGKHARIKHFMPDTVIGAFMTGIRSECPEFTNALLDTAHFDEEVSKNMGATINQITGYMFSKMEFIVPYLEEQKKIGQYFEGLDHLITLHQSKHEKLVALKKAMLEKMFPQNDSNIPEVRFAGFTSPWERRKVSELADFSKGRGYSKGDLKEIGTPIILYGRLYTKYQFEIGEVDTFADIKPGSVLSKGDEVIVPASGETAEDIAIAAAVVKPGILLGGDLNILHPFGFMNPSFVALSISNGQPQKELARKAQGKSVVHVHNSDIQEVTICYPDREEQDKIVSTFSQLDNLITFQQRKHESLKRVKAALLQKMFV